MRGSGWIFVLGFGIVASSCLDPTEIVLQLSTDVACSAVVANGVAIAIGAPDDDDASSVHVVTMLCSPDGSIGSLVVTPSGAIDQDIGVRVTLGVDASAETCGPPRYDGCIVSRRALRFDPHTPLTLPISLDQACIGVPCTPDSTCVNGTCVDASVPPCTGICGVEDAAPPPVDAPPDAPAVPTILMFGGSKNCDGTTPALLGDAWTWDGTAWKPAVVPTMLAQRYLAGAAANVVHGGFGLNDQFLGDMWIESGGTWTSPSINTPSPRSFAAMSTIGLGGAPVLYSGCSSCYSTAAPINDTWTWNGTGWASAGVSAPSPARIASAMAPFGKVALLFGGITSYATGATDLQDTWTFDGNAWSVAPSNTKPPVRDGHAMATLGSTVVLFGGEYLVGNAFAGRNDTWTWNGTTWILQQPSASPGLRFFSVMAPLGNTLVLFGGVDATSTKAPPLAETWIWDGKNWMNKTDVNNSPPARCGAMMVVQ